MAENWDAGEMGCGALIFELRRRIDALKPGERLELVAQDPGAQLDLPAWCRMTGHKLIRSDHPNYVIERTAD